MLTIDEEESQDITVCLSIPGIETKAHQSVVAQNEVTLEHLTIHYASKHWIRVYSYGSSQGAVRNGGAGGYVQYPDGTTKSLSAPTGQLSTNYRSEQQAATQAMSHLIQQAISKSNIVFLIDYKLVLQSVQNESQDNSTRNFKHQFSIISRTNNAALQWIPAHCGITGKESADNLAKPSHSVTSRKKDSCKKEVQHSLENKARKYLSTWPHHTSKPTRANNDI